MAKPNITFELKSHGDREYIQYTIKNDETMQFDNIHYVKIDVTSDEFKNTMQNVGGFCANMTTRHIAEMKEKTKKDITTIMLCCIPQETNEFIFCFTYMDQDDNIIDMMKDNNYYDYKYLTYKLRHAVTEIGMVYDLEDDKKYDAVTKLICPHPSTGFGIDINGKPITYDDILIYPDTDIFKKDIRENLAGLGANAVRFEFDYDIINDIHLKGTVPDRNDGYIKYYQAESGIEDIDEYIEKMKQKYDEGFSIKNVSTGPFEIRVDVGFLRKIANKSKRN